MRLRPELEGLELGSVVDAAISALCSGYMRQGLTGCEVGGVPSSAHMVFLLLLKEELDILGPVVPHPIPPPVRRSESRKRVCVDQSPEGVGVRNRSRVRKSTFACLNEGKLVGDTVEEPPGFVFTAPAPPG